MRTLDEFIEECIRPQPDEDGIAYPHLYSRVRNTQALALTEVERRNPYADQEWYQANKPEIRRLLKDAILISCYVLEEMK